MFCCFFDSNSHKSCVKVIISFGVGFDFFFFFARRHSNRVDPRRSLFLFSKSADYSSLLPGEVFFATLALTERGKMLDARSACDHLYENSLFRKAQLNVKR